MDSVEAVLRKKRLIYLSRILITGPPVLLALLQTVNRGRKMPWWHLILDDLEQIKAASTKLAELPNPRNDIQP
eukprot:5854203-Karenia_brevis.AAC.1